VATLTAKKHAEKIEAGIYARLDLDSLKFFAIARTSRPSARRSGFRRCAACCDTKHLDCQRVEFPFAAAI
jgi:hypothetical protein